jgi:aminoglycoside/choline kinase family phosphotransferase
MKTMPAREEAMRDFLARSGWGAAALEPLPGDASTRHYTRLRLGERTAMLMDQPQQAEAPNAAADATPEERARLGYNATARLAGADCRRFVAAAQFLRRAGLAAPEILAADAADGLLLLEDLGDDLYTDVIAKGHDETPLYEAAIDVLARLHDAAAPPALAEGLPLFAYDETALIAETDLLTEWFLPMALGRPAREEETEEHRALWRAALRDAGHAAPVFVHRDFHAQNLLWRGSRAGLARVGLIDFQDAVAGSTAYDLISLLEDARRDVAPELAHAMTARYLNVSGTRDAAGFRAAAALFAAQRNAKIVGIFARLSRRDGKPRYLSYLPRVWRYMESDLAHPALHDLQAWYDRVLPKQARVVAQGVAA